MSNNNPSDRAKLQIDLERLRQAQILFNASLLAAVLSTCISLVGVCDNTPQEFKQDNLPRSFLRNTSISISVELTRTYSTKLTERR